MTRIVPLVLFALIACAGAQQQRQIPLIERGDPAHPVFVGRGTDGEIVVAASHYDAMNGLAVAAADIGAKEGDLLMCTREMLTGTHVPKWICRYPSEAERERQATQDWLVKARNCMSHCGGADTAH